MIELFIKEVLDNQKPRDLQYIYMAPGGDYRLAKDLLTSLRVHSHRFNSFTAIDAHERQRFNELRGTVVSRQIFIRSQSLIAC